MPSGDRAIASPGASGPEITVGRMAQDIEIVTGLGLREAVRQRYAAAAASASAGCVPTSDCCGPTVVGQEDAFGAALYGEDLTDDLPDGAVLASLGCGNPLAVASLHPGETVLDLGSGGGIDVILSARRVAPTGRAIGVDMTEEMLELARSNAATAGVTNVEFRKGHIENIPLPDRTVDVVISNCVVNLSADKAAVLAEVARVLRPGGRVAISDVVAENHLTPQQRGERGDRVGCIAGALSFAEYEQGLNEVGLTDVEIESTHEVAEGMHAAVVRARQPG